MPKGKKHTTDILKNDSKAPQQENIVAQIQKANKKTEESDRIKDAHASGIGSLGRSEENLLENSDDSQIEKGVQEY